MRTKLFRFFILAFLVLSTATSCFDGMTADVSESDVRKGRKLTTSMCAAPMQYEIGTKSLLGTRSDAVVYNWNLFVFDGGVLVGKYYKSTGEDIEFDVKLDHDYEYMALANVGNKTGLFGAGTTKSQVAAMELTDVSSGYVTNGLPMAWASSAPIRFTRSQYDSQTARLDVQFTRLTGKYQIAINKHGLNIWSFRVKSLVMKGASTIKPFASTANAASSYSTVSDQATSSDITLLDTYNSMDVSSPAVFYPLENIMATPASLSGNTDPWNKVEGNVPNGKYPTYVEMVAEATLNDGSGITKDVTYRFYLGNDALSDFRVERNVSHSLTFYPDDASITNGHGGNWKITPGPFDDTRDLDFERQTTESNRFRIKAGTSSAEGIVKVPSGLSYVVKKTSNNITVKNTSTSAVIANNAATDASSLTLEIAAGTKETAEVTIETIDGALNDVLHLDIFNAFLEITDPVPPVRNWGWNTYGTLSAQTFTVRTSVDYTMVSPSGWNASKSLVSDSGGEKIWTVTVYPNGPSEVTTAPGESLPLTFQNAEIDDGVATLTRDFKPTASVDNANLSWIASKSGEGDGINVQVTSNESWTVTKGSDWDDNKWGISMMNGTGNGTIKVWPKTPNATIPPVDITTSFIIVPNRGTDAEKVTVNMTHQKAAVNLDITEDGNSWEWKSTAGFTFHVTGNVNWQAVLSDTEKWEFVGASTGSGNGTVTVKPKGQNLSTSQPNNATLSLSCTDAGITVTPAPTATLSQGVHPNIGLASSDNLQWAWDALDAKDITLTLSPENYGWQAQLVNGDATHWQMTENHTNNTISIQPTSVNDDVNNTKSIQVRITATDSDDTQSSAIVTCTHNKREPYFNFVDPSQQNLSWRWYENASNTITVEFSTSEEWTPSVSVGGSYFTATKNGNSVIIAPTNANDGAVREGTVSLAVDGHPELNKTISLTQEAKPSLSVAPDNKEWVWNNTNSQNFTVTCSSGYTWSAAKTSDPGNKFTLTNTTGASSAAFTVTPAGINENTNQGNAATITVSLVNANDPHAGEVTATVNVTQTKKVQFYITPTSNEWGWQGGTFQFTVVDNQGLSWTPEVVGTNASAFTAVKSGNNVNVIVNQNNDFDVKSATLRIKVGGEVKASASLSQQGHPWLELTALDGTAWAYDETSGKRFEVSSSGISSWTPTIDNTSEFTVSTNGSIVTVTPKSANTGTSPRSVRVTVTSNNYSVDGQSDYHDLSQGVNGNMVTGATLQVYNGSAWVTDATFTVGTEQTYRIKVDRLSGSTDYVTSGFELTSGNSGVVSVNGNKISTTAAGEGSTSVSTTYSEINSSVTITVQPAAPTYTYTMAVKESGGDYGSSYSVSCTGDLYLQAWLTQRFTNGSSTPDAGFEPIEVTSSCSWNWDDSWPASVNAGELNAQAYSAPSSTTGTLTVYYSGGYNVVNNPVEVSVSVYDITNNYYDITLNGEHDPVVLDYGQTVDAQVWRQSYSYWYGYGSWIAISPSIGCYDSQYLTSGSHNLVTRGVVSKSGSGPTTIENTNETGSVIIGYAKSTYGASAAITLNPKPAATIDHYEYQGLSVSISANPTSIAAAGGSSTLSYSASWQKRAVYTDNSRGDWEDESDTPTVTGEATGFSRNGTSVTISANTGTDSRSVTYTASYSLPDGSVIVSGSSSDEASVTITQAGNEPVFVRYEYKDLAVSISADPTSIPAAGGSSTLSYSATWKVREVWSDGAKAWTDDSGTPSISGGTSWAVLQSDNKTVNIAETGISMSRSATFTASYEFPSSYSVVSGSSSASASVTIEQDRTPYLESLEFRINGSKSSAELNAGNGYSLSYSLKGIYSDGSEVDYAPSSYTVTYNTSARGLLFSQGTVSLNGNNYYELDEGSYSNIDEYVSVTYAGLTSNQVHLTSNITWEFLGIGYHAEASNGGEVTFHKFYHSTLSTNTIRDAGALTDFTFNGSITSVTGVPNISDVNLSLSTRAGGILSITAFSTYSYYEYTAVINVNSSFGHYTLTVYGGSDNGWPFFSFDGITYQANAH